EPLADRPGGPAPGSSNLTRIIISDASSGRVIATVTERVGVDAVAFSPDGATLATCCSDSGQVDLWKHPAPPARQVHRLPQPWRQRPAGHGVQPGGKTLATCQTDGYHLPVGHRGQARDPDPERPAGKPASSHVQPRRHHAGYRGQQRPGPPAEP